MINSTTHPGKPRYTFEVTISVAVSTTSSSSSPNPASYISARSHNQQQILIGKVCKIYFSAQVASLILIYFSHCVVEPLGLGLFGRPPLLGDKL